MITRVRQIRLRVIVVVATALGLCSALQAFYYLSTFVPDRRGSFGVLLAFNLNYWYSWALLAPLILWVARRAPLEPGTLRRNIPIHLTAVFTTAVLHVSFVLLGRAAINSWLGVLKPSGIAEFERMFFLNLNWAIMTYCAIVGLSYGQRGGQIRDATTSRTEPGLTEEQLESLRRHVQPHFLFNTLNMVSGLMQRDVKLADAMLVRVGRLLRARMDSVDAQEVALSHELEVVRDYVAIEQARFVDRLTVDFNIEPDAEDCSVPNYLLQPLVENSINHGVCPRPGPGRVCVNAARVGDVLRLEVTDDGVGVSADLLCDLQHGAGLTDTRSRLEQLYGPRYGLAIASSLGGGFSVQIELPVRSGRQHSLKRS